MEQRRTAFKRRSLLELPMVDSSVNMSSSMFGRPKNKNGEPDRYYLLPGMGRANRRKHALLARWAVVVGLLTSGVVALVMYYISRSNLGR